MDKDIDRQFWAAHRALGKTLQALNEAVKGHNSLNSKDLRGACAKVPNTPRRAGLIKS